jgi:hypothetical protein
VWGVLYMCVCVFERMHVRSPPPAITLF